MEKTYKTKDLAEASFLLAKSVRLLEIDRERKVCWFIFEGRLECEKLLREYWFGGASVTAKVFFDSMQTLKNRIFAKE